MQCSPRQPPRGSEKNEGDNSHKMAIAGIWMQINGIYRKVVGSPAMVMLRKMHDSQSDGSYFNLRFLFVGCFSFVRKVKIPRHDGMPEGENGQTGGSEIAAP